MNARGKIFREALNNPKGLGLKKNFRPYHHGWVLETPCSAEISALFEFFLSKN